MQLSIALWPFADRVRELAPACALFSAQLRMCGEVARDQIGVIAVEGD